MKKIGTALLFFLAIASGYAQLPDLKGTVRGTIIDSLSNQKIAFATITIKIENNTKMRSALSKEDGSYVIEKLTIGKHNISVLNVGYKKFSKEIEITNDNAT